MSPRDDDLQRTPDGDLVEPPEHDCDDGWTHDTTDRPRPCPTCRPATVDRIQAQRRRADLDWLPLEALRPRTGNHPPDPDPDTPPGRPEPDQPEPPDLPAPTDTPPTGR